MPTSQLSEIKGTGNYKRKPGMEIVHLARQNCGCVGGADSDWGNCSLVPLLLLKSSGLRKFAIKSMSCNKLGQNLES